MRSLACRAAAHVIVSILVASTASAAGLPRRPALGVSMAPVPDAQAREAGLASGDAALITSLSPGLTAEKAGIRAGDILLKLDGRPVSVGTAAEMVRQMQAGHGVVFQVWREDRMKELDGELTEKPRDPGNEKYTVAYDDVETVAGRMRTIVSRPRGPGRHPAVLFIQGFAPISYDYPLAGNGIAAPILYDFANRGFVTMRVEKPGVGDSEGGPFAMVDYTSELDIYRQALRRLKGMDEVDADRVFIPGHSMGGAFGPMIASEIPVRASRSTVSRREPGMSTCSIRCATRISWPEHPTTKWTLRFATRPACSASSCRRGSRPRRWLKSTLSSDP